MFCSRKEKNDCLKQAYISQLLNMLSDISWPSCLFNNNHQREAVVPVVTAVGDKISSEVHAIYCVFEKHLSKLKDNDIRNFLRENRPSLPQSTDSNAVSYRIVRKGER